MSSDALIFGCSTISHLESRAESRRLLGQATELGIVHFDTARAYGEGESEVVLGSYLKGRRDQTIITTKYGLAPPIANPRLRHGFERAAASPRMNPGLQLARRVRRALRPSLFSPRKIRAALETSLRALQTDYVDFFLLHEATAAQAQRRMVTHTLERLVTEGKVRQFGLGSAYAKIGPFAESVPTQYRVFQFEHSPLARVPLEAVRASGRIVFTHSAVRSLSSILTALASCPDLVRRYRAELDLDVADPQVLAGMLLAYSHGQNREGKVLFSTGSARHLAANVTTFSELTAFAAERRMGINRFLEEVSLAIA